MAKKVTGKTKIKHAVYKTKTKPKPKNPKKPPGIDVKRKRGSKSGKLALQ